MFKWEKINKENSSLLFSFKEDYKEELLLTLKLSPAYIMYINLFLLTKMSQHLWFLYLSHMYKEGSDEPVYLQGLARAFAAHTCKIGMLLKTLIRI